MLGIGGVPEHFNLPWQLAIESGAAPASGLSARWHEYSTGTGAMLAELAARKLDLAVLLTEGVALGLARGLPIQPVSLYTTSPLIWGVHVAPASPYTVLGELGPAKFAISRPGSGSHLMSFALALEQGWPADQLEFVVVDNLPGAVAAFREGRADVLLWEHVTTAPTVEAGLMRRIGDFVSPWPAWVLCASLSSWHRDEAAIHVLFARVVEEAQRLRADPEAAQRIAGRYGLSAAAVSEWLARTEWVDRETSPDAALTAASAMLRAAGAV